MQLEIPYQIGKIRRKMSLRATKVITMVARASCAIDQNPNWRAFLPHLIQAESNYEPRPIQYAALCIDLKRKNL